MEHLRAEGIKVVALESLLNERDRKSADPRAKPQVAITFDDGYLDIYTEAMPLLTQYDYPFTVFINTASVGAPGYMSWPQLGELKQAGASIANHTVSHPYMVRQRPDENKTQWRERIGREIEQAQTEIRDKLGQAPALLAYPYGEFNREVMAVVKELGYIALGQQSGAVGPNTDLQRVPRFAMGGSYAAMDTFATKVQAMPLPVESEGVRSQQADRFIARAGQQPVIVLRLAKSGLAERLNCFYQGEPLAPTVINERELEVKVPDTLAAGRTRINCTARAPDSKRYYWYSYPFFTQGEDGRWQHQD
ncbi:polysaccharide deacetylase family protein [Gilvimarinus sp. 2_MG-2023]|uniref:polysaccharide deacetylase family protein n=1 Tax=Gilvimarinus sp. 2_MG-2023 TaxID=3062666 RepID=UPI0026E342C8|nr:polysaccharide deacetylase family protein [Gilvimarinus sp. 2_MG-2023]MDO6571307.1 polysaccharide deacetylase family protein [Gilvimarinus sp. 2_MG-2023]